jgi:hypothetical protein
MTAAYSPEGMTAADIIAAVGKAGVVIAGGLHKDIKSACLLPVSFPLFSKLTLFVAKYLRIG